MIDRGWIFYPALRHALAYASGIVLAKLFLPSTAMSLPAAALALGAVAWLVYRGMSEALALVLPIVVCVAAIMHATGSEDLFEPFDGALLRRGEIIGRILSDPVERNGRLELLVACDSVVYRSSAFRPDCRVLVAIDDTTGVARAAPRAGDHLSAVGSLSCSQSRSAPWDPDMSGYMKGRGIGLTLTVRSATGLYLFDRDDLSPIERLVAGCRRIAREFGAEMVTGEEGDIVVALLVGERTAVDAETRDAFMRTGTIHVLAVSGLHVGLIALVLGVGLSWIPNRQIQLPLFLLAIAVYVLIAGGGSSILRAAVMGGAFMGARLAGRRSRALNTLGFSALVVLVLDPTQLFDIGFQLSFASVAGIILLAGALRSPLPGRPSRGFLRSTGRALAAALWLSTSAQLFTLPLLLFHFGSVPTLSLPANLVVVPLTTAALGAGLAGAILLLAVPWLAGWFGASAYLATTAALAVVRISAGLPPGTIDIPTISAPAMLLLLSTLVIVALAPMRSRFLWRCALWLMLLAMTIAIDGRSDTLRADAGSLLFWYRSGDGSSVARLDDDTLRIYTASARKATMSEERLRRRIGARALAVVPLDSTMLTNDSEPMMINDNPPECLLESPGAILSSSAQVAPALVTVDDQRLLRLPLGRLPEEAVILRSGPHWEVVRWR